MVLNPIAYGILSFPQLEGAFLTRIPENTVKIIRLIQNLVQSIIGIQL